MEGVKRPFNSRTRFIFFIITIMVTVATVSFITFSNSPKQKFKRQLDLGNKYLGELNYEQAVTAFTVAIDMDPTNEEAKGNLVKAFLGWNNNLIDDNDYESAIYQLTKALEIIPESEDVKEALVQNYLKWGNDYAEKGDTDKAIEILSEGYSSLNDIRLSDAIEKINKRVAAQKRKDIMDLGAELFDIFHDKWGRHPSLDHAARYLPRDVYYPRCISLIEKLDEYIDELNENFIEGICDSKDFPELRTHTYNSQCLTLADAYYFRADVYLWIGDLDKCMQSRMLLANLISREEITGEHEYDWSYDDREWYVTFDGYGRKIEDKISHDGVDYDQKRLWSDGALICEEHYSHNRKDGRDYLDKFEYKLGESGVTEAKIESVYLNGNSNPHWVHTFPLKYDGSTVTFVHDSSTGGSDYTCQINEWGRLD